MTEPNSPQAGTSRLSDLKGKVGHIPVIRRNSFVYGFLSLLVLYGIFLLPSSGSPETVDMSRIILFCLLLLVWALIIFTDELKPEKLKTATVFSIFIIAGWLYYRYSTARWGEMGFLFFNLEMIKKAWPTLVTGFWTAGDASFARVESMGKSSTFFMDDVSIFDNAANINVFPKSLHCCLSSSMTRQEFLEQVVSERSHTPRLKGVRRSLSRQQSEHSHLQIVFYKKSNRRTLSSKHPYEG